MDKSQAINNFWQSFHLPAYDASTVPDDAEMPYITYECTTSALGQPVSMMASVWYRSKSWAEISQKADEIAKYIGMGGVLERYDDGAVWIARGQPFAQRMSDPDDMVRRIVILTQAEFLSAD